MDQLDEAVRLALVNAARGIDDGHAKRQDVGRGPAPTSTTSENLLGSAPVPASSSTSSSTVSGNPNRPSGEGIETSKVASQSASKATATNASTATGGTAGGISDSGEPSSSGDSKSSGGMSTGAIVGIVVGVVGGLLLIGGIAFFILRKRRRSKQLDGGYNGNDAAGTYMVDKETQGRATDSPNSPYTDENQTQHIPIENSTRDGPPTATLPRTSTGGSRDERLNSSGAQTPQGVSSNVAHLVEDGMTAEEIARLEEEERQLDDEIERAARR